MAERKTAVPPNGIPTLGGIPRQTAHEQVLEQLRGAILGGALAPGTPLVLSELSTQLGVSRTPIREAIRDLAGEGLVDFDSYRSSMVHAPTLAEAQEVYGLRLVLEPLGVRRAVQRISDPQIARARQVHETMLRTSDLGAWVQLNRDFHAILIEPADSPRLLAIITSLRNAAAIQVSLSLRAEVSQLDEANREHGLILDAYVQRDADLAVQLTGRHLRSTLDVVEAYERGAGAPPAG
ncbi:MAG TPA: GntR family transcriptional regulator [Baekduia sp.]|uniref:GntR family transcriptional regulator n=1 Tax=Baekduia sp. TaxID=2600305 RepID=UPI002C385CD4|nr:GntR family transcriptional regulator [Baekduia sp.]HMJ35595.1 GntR family transcriptional regulator [Baekduia sp.]